MNKMKTPIFDFVSAYAESNSARLHMPGHKGNGPLGFEKYDITEISGADALFLSDGIIRESEDNLSSIFDTARSLYSCEGSSLCVRSMLYLVRLIKGEGYVLATRNAHSSFISALALLDLDVKWLCADDYRKCQIDADTLDAYLNGASEKPICVYVTSPDYLGGICDIASLAKVCERHGVLLLVDNAHGAYLKFLEKDSHPIALGAHMCCDSAHKTLPTLTGGAYLHISKNAPSELVSRAKDAMALFASTSPSYLILASLDKTNEYLSDGYKARLGAFVTRLNALKERLVKNGYTLCGEDQLKIVIKANDYGYTGTALASILEQDGIFPEMSDYENLVLMLTPENTNEELSRLEGALLKIPQKQKISAPVFDFALPSAKMSIREALFSQRETLDIENALGRISASSNFFCPPAISIVVAGEEITSEAIKLMKHCGYTKISVVK